MESFAQCLKTARRNIYVADGGYNVLVMCANSKHMEIAFDEAVHVLEASSLKVERVNRLERKIYCERGGTFWFRMGDMDVDRLKGFEWPHIIVLCALGNLTENALTAMNRTSNPRITPLYQHASI